MTKSPKSLFIVIEGLDGSGKTLVSRRLKSILQQTHGKNVDLTFEPHDPSTAGLFIRQVLTKRIKNVPMRTLALAFALNRADHYSRTIEPFLSTADERIIVCDRYYMSSLVYQTSESVPMEDVMFMNKGARRPDITFFLNASTKTCYERMRKRPEDKELFERNLSHTRSQYLRAIRFLREKGEQVFEVDADQDLQVVLNTILDILIQYGPDWLSVQHTLIELPQNTFTLNGQIEVQDNAISIARHILELIPSPMASSDLSSLKQKVEDEVNRLSYDELALLFINHLQRWGYRFADRLPWTELLAYELEFPMPLGVTQRGTALLLTGTQRYDAVTKKIQVMLDQNPQMEDISRLSDFMFVLDTSPTSETPRFYERESRGSKLSPAIRIIGRIEVARMVLADTLALFVSDKEWELMGRPDIREYIKHYVYENDLGIYYDHSIRYITIHYKTS